MIKTLLYIALSTFLITGCTSTPWWINFIYAIIGILLVWYFLKNINDYEDIFVKVKKELKTIKKSN